MIGAETAAVAIATTAGAAGALAWLIRRTRQAQRTDRRLARLRRHTRTPSATAAHAHGATRADTIAWTRLVQAFGILIPIGAEERAKLARLLAEAGWSRADALTTFLGVKAGTALIGAFAGWLLGSASGEAYLQLVLIGAGALLGNVAPEFALRQIAKGRTRRRVRALPDALDLIVMNLETGVTFERALQGVSEEVVHIEPLLARTLSDIETRLRLSASRREMLAEIHREHAIEGLRNLAMTLLQAERYGTPLSDAVRNIAQNERLQRANRVQIHAEKLPVYMTLPMMTLVVPGTLMLVAGPAVLQAMKALTGF